MLATVFLKAWGGLRGSAFRVGGLGLALAEDDRVQGLGCKGCEIWAWTSTPSSCTVEAYG